MKILEEKGYIYQKHLSTGGEGEVHLIRSVDHEYVAKIVPRLDAESFALLEQIGSMKIPHIPQIREVFNHRNKTIIIRDYIEGCTLYAEIKKNGYLTLSRARSIIVKLCETLQAFHSAAPAPIIYRDLKPENIIVDPEGGIFLIDLGIARRYKSEATRDTVLAGTRGYTAPEVMAGMQSDNRSDIYSAGLLFYEMLTGKSLLDPPYQIRPVKESDELLPQWLDEVIAKATDINQTNRYARVEDFVSDIQNPRSIQRKNKKRPAMRVAGFILAVAAAGAAAWLIWGGGGSQRYDMLLSLDFDREEDKAWVTGCDEPDGRFAFFNGQLYVLEDECSIDYDPKPGMIVHYLVRQPEDGSVGVDPYAINAAVSFECAYTDEKTGTDYCASSHGLSGIPFKNGGQFFDALFYITQDGGAVYAFAIDEDAHKICYTAYQIPEFMQNDALHMKISNRSAQGLVIVESIHVAEGSLQAYLNDNFETYRANKKRVDAFLEQTALPELALESS